jgi:hypothetical protein
MNDNTKARKRFNVSCWAVNPRFNADLLNLKINIEMENFKEGQELEFDVYGTQVKGKYLSMIEEKIIKIEVTYDSSEVTEVGCTSNVHQSFLVR